MYDVYDTIKALSNPNSPSLKQATKLTTNFGNRTNLLLLNRVETMQIHANLLAKLKYKVMHYIIYPYFLTIL